MLGHVAKLHHMKKKKKKRLFQGLGGVCLSVCLSSFSLSFICLGTISKLERNTKTMPSMTEHNVFGGK